MTKLVTKYFTVGPELKISYEGDAGIDLMYWGEKPFSLDNGIVYKIHTGLFVEIPVDKCGIIFERSGLGAKHGITIHGRIIDSGYRGEIIVLMSRHSFSSWDTNEKEPKGIVSPEIKPGDRIAQMIIVDCHPAIMSVDKFEDLTPSERGEKGLGSSGAK